MTYLFATYSIIFTFIFLYISLIDKRYTKLQKDFDSIKEMIHELKSRG